MESVLLALVLLACPVGMGLMMWMMGRRKNKSEQSPASGTIDQLIAERDRVDGQIARAEADREQSATATGSRS